MSKQIQNLLGCILVSGIVGLSGCAQPGKVTGGGWISSAAWDGSKANFGFNGDSCDSWLEGEGKDTVWYGVDGHFNFHDMHVKELSHHRYIPKQGVKLNGTVTGVALCDDSRTDDLVCGKCGAYKHNRYDYTGEEGAYKVSFNYRSTNPFAPGEGAGEACVIDNGEGANAEKADYAYVLITSGPYYDYENEGEVQGNIQAHPCNNDSEY
jgi:hypothetical protein